MFRSGPTPSVTDFTLTTVTVRLAIAFLAVTFSVGRALAHAGHDGAASESVTWLAYGPVLVGAVLVATAAGLSQEGVVSMRRAFAIGAVGVALFAVGVVGWLL